MVCGFLTFALNTFNIQIKNVIDIQQMYLKINQTSKDLADFGNSKI